MISPATSDIPPAARDAVAALAARPTTPTKIAVIGGIGTGKTKTLAAVRAVLRSAGVPVLTRAPHIGEKPAEKPGEKPGAAVVIDDAHLLTSDELLALADRVSDPDATVVVATEPHQHNGALRSIMLAMERENASVSLGVLSPGELNRAAGAALDKPPTSELLRSLMAVTAGVPLLVQAALNAARSLDDGSPAVAFAQAAQVTLNGRLRGLDEPVLETLLIASLAPELGAADVAATLRLTVDRAQAVVDQARASGLVEPSHSPPFLRSVHRAVSQIVGAARHHDVELSLMASQLELSTLSTELALRLAEHEVRDQRLADFLVQQAGQASGQPSRAARLYRAAVDAGAAGLDARLADALALIGDCGTAGRLADQLLASDDAAQRAAGVRIAASVAAHDGSMSQAADLFRWLGPYPDAFVSAAGAVVLLAAGDLPSARTALDARSTGPPTSAARASHSLADGLLSTIDKPFPVVVARLGQALTVEQSVNGAAPDTPVALLTLAALHGGDPVRARSVITRAVKTGGVDVFSHRHRLLLGWTKMQDGQLASAGTDAASVAESGLHRRDALWATALKVGIARRTGDSGALQKHWYAAMEVLAEYAVDLFSLLPLGELWMAAARLRTVDRLQHQLDQAFGLLVALGNPVLWSVPLHWSGVHAGILANSPDAVAPHGQALSAAAAHSPFAKSLAGAGRVWLRVLANHVDIDEVTAAARSLSESGHTWDATRLASQAALQTPDPKVAGAMLQLARDLRMTSPVDEAAGPEPAPPLPAGALPKTRPASTRLSEREREVAELLLLGMPYRDIGGQLFISAKTVEHHVARIRRRLGADSRSEMLSMLRTMLTPQN
jgi:DNA-binding CsgD family transcriptional regulator